MADALTVAFWEEGGENTADILLRGYNESGRAVTKLVTSAGDPIASFPVLCDVRPGGGHVELTLETQPASNGFDHDATHNTAAVHY